MKDIHSLLCVGASTIAACFLFAMVAQANRRIENKVLEDGSCFSPQVFENDCNITEDYTVLSKRLICTGSCGYHDGKRVMEIWQIEVR